MKQAVTLKARYERLKTKRQVFLDRAIECSKLTIPTLIPPEGHNESTTYYTPWQGVGARGVNNLASKLLLSILPPNSPFFRLMVDEFTEDKLAGDPAKKSLIEQGLAKVERAVQDEIEGTGIRNPVYNVLRHLVTAGNVCAIMPAQENMRVFSIHHFVCERDPYGNLLDTITKECISRSTASDEILSILDPIPDEDDKPVNKDEIEIYTRYYRKGKRLVTFQEANGKKVPGSDGSWPLDKSPLLVLRWTHVDGEDYGRSHVEDYIGDLISLEGLSRSIVEGSAASAKVVYMLNPNGVTSHDDLAKAESGDVIAGVENDVFCLQANKQADLSITYEAVKTLTDRLAYAFLMNSAIQRNGERVTAEEIRFMASELDDALGGVYSLLSQEFQLPFISRLMAKMTTAGKLPALPKGVVKPAIVTGLEALGRGHDVTKLQTLLGAIAQMPPQAAARVNWGEAVNRLCTSIGVDPEGLILSDEEFANQQQQQQRQAQMQQAADIAGKAAPAVVKAYSDHVASQNGNGATTSPSQGS